MAKVRSKPRKSTAQQKAAEAKLTLPSALQTHTHLIYIGIIALLLIVFFHEAFFGGKVFNVPDNLSALVSQPYIEKAKEGGINAFWNPYVFGGMPTWGSSLPGHGMYLHTFLSPLQPMVILQVYGWAQSIVNVLPLPGMFWDIFNFFLLGVFMYMFGIRRKFEPFVAFLVAVSVVFSLYSLNWIMAGHNTKITVFAWLPAILLLIDLLFEKRSILRVALLVAALHFTFNSGHVQMIFYSAMVIGLYVLYKWYEGAKPVQVLLVGAITLGAAAFAFLMLSGPYFATWEYKDFSIRGAGSGGSGHGNAGGGLDYDYATQWSFLPIETLTFIIPSFLGFGSPTYWGSMPFTESPVYLGVVVMSLAIIGIAAQPRNKFMHFWLFLFILSTVISFGRNFGLLYNFMFENLPFFNNFRIPSMVLFLNSLSAGMLAGLGLASIVRFLRERNESEVTEKRLTRAVWIPAAVVGLVALFLLVGRGGFDGMVQENLEAYNPNLWQGMQQVEQYAGAGRLMELPEQYRGMTRDNLYSMALDDTLLALLFTVLAGGILLAFIRRRMGYMALQAGLLVLLVADMWIVDYKPMHMVPQTQQEQSLQPSEAVQFLRQDPGVFRILPAPIHADDNWYTAFGIQSVAGYHPAKMKYYDDVRNSIFGQFTFQSPQQLDGTNWALLCMMNTKYLVVPADWALTRPWLRMVHAGQQERVYQNDYVLPRGFFVGRTEIIPDDAAMFKKISVLPGYEPDHIAYLSLDPGNLPAAVPDSVITSSHAEVSSFGLNHIAFDVATPVDAVFKISENYYPSGWTATIDGKEAEILRSDYLFRALVVPAGSHKIEMHFQPRSYEAGLIATTITNYLLAAIFLIYGVLWLRKRLGAKSAAKKEVPAGEGNRDS